LTISISLSINGAVKSADLEGWQDILPHKPSLKETGEGCCIEIPERGTHILQFQETNLNIKP